MAGSGLPPKAPETRRRRNKPTLGEVRAAPAASWRFGPVPAPPDGMCKASDVAWRGWFSGWWASFWTEGDLPGLRIVAMVHNAVATGNTQLAGELRLQMDGYGITPKGRLSLRWSPPLPAASAQPSPPDPTEGPYAHLKALK